MARGRKPNKRVRIEVEMDMANGSYLELKSRLKEIVETYFCPGDTLVYLSIDTTATDNS